jgi:predicted NUDIX family NTP pyrophosphohydrolase
MLNGNSIKVTYQYDGGGSSILDIDCTGSFYSMKDFNAWLIPLLQYGVNTDPLLT